MSERTKRAANPGVEAWFAATDSLLMFVSALTLGEVRNGAERLSRRDPIGASVHLERLARLKSTFGPRILPVTGPIAEEWGRLDALAGPLPIVDGLIAATALVHNLIVVTRNTADFERTGASVLNPFSS